MYGKWFGVIIVPVFVVLLVIALIASWGLPLIALLIALPLGSLAIFWLVVTPNSDRRAGSRRRPSAPPLGGGPHAADEMGSTDAGGAPVSGEGAR